MQYLFHNVGTYLVNYDDESSLQPEYKPIYSKVISYLQQCDLLERLTPLDERKANVTRCSLTGDNSLLMFSQMQTKIDVSIQPYFD